MRNRNTKYYLFLVSSVLFLFFFFQNCSVSKVSFQSLASLQGEKSAPESEGGVAGGNGGGYEGKPDGVFVREIPNFKCFDQTLQKPVSAPAAKLEITTGAINPTSSIQQTAKLTINEEKRCAQSIQQPSVGRIISSQFTQMQNEVVALDDGLYRNVLAVQKNVSLLNEAWCRGIDSSEKLEVVVHHELNLSNFSSDIYFDKLRLTQSVSTFQRLNQTHTRRISRQKIYYNNSSSPQDFSLEIDAQKTKAASNGQFKAQIRFKFNQETIERTLSCHLGAELDGRIWPSPLLTGLKIIQSKPVAQAQKLLFIGEDANGARSLYLWTFAIPAANSAYPRLENLLPLSSGTFPSQKNAGLIKSFILSTDEQNLIFASDFAPVLSSSTSAPGNNPLQLYQLLSPQINLPQNFQSSNSVRLVRKLSGHLLAGAQGVAEDYRFSQDENSVIYKDGETSQENLRLKSVTLTSGNRIFLQDALPISSGLNIAREFVSLMNNKILGKIGLGFSGAFYLFDESQNSTSTTTLSTSSVKDLQIAKLLPPGCFLPANSSPTFNTHPFMVSVDETNLYFAADCTSPLPSGALTLATRLFKSDMSSLVSNSITLQPTTQVSPLETLATHLNPASTLEQSSDGEYLHVALNSGVAGHDDHKLIHLRSKIKIPLGDVLDFKFVSPSRAIVISWFGDPSNAQDAGETRVGYVDLQDQNVNWSQTLAQHTHIERLNFDRESLSESTVNLLWPDVDGQTKVVTFNFVTGQSQVLAQFKTQAKTLGKIHISQKQQRVIFIADQENDGNNELYVFDWSRSDSEAVLLMINDRYIEYGSVQSFSELADGRIIFTSGPSISGASSALTNLFEWKDEP